MRRREAGEVQEPAAQEHELMARSTCRGHRLLPTIALVCAGCFGPAQAEKGSIEPSIDTRATWTDNVAFEEQGVKESDTLLEATPAVVLRGEGKRFRIAGHL